MLSNLQDISYGLSLINRKVKNFNLLNTEVGKLMPYQTHVKFSIEMLYNDPANQSIFSIDAM